MKKEKMIYFILLVLFFITGYTHKELKNTEENSLVESNLSEGKTEKVNPYNYKDLYSLPREYGMNAAKENEDVAWNHQEVYNIHRLDNFIKNVENNTEDMIRVVGFTKEGDAIIQDLEYDGEMIKLTEDSTRDEYSDNPSVEIWEYEKIVIEERYNEQYEGTFTEYFLEDNEGEKSWLVLQLFKKEE